MAACFIMLYHFFQTVITASYPGTFIHHGYLSVDLFFVLSGFVMMLTYEGQFRSGFSANAYANFLYKRFGRIYPLYAAITLSFVICLHFDLMPGFDPASLKEITLNLLLIHGWGTAQSVAGPTWSISTEFAAYILFPVFVYLTAGKRSTGPLILTIVALTTLFSIGRLATEEIHEVVHDVSIRNGPLDVFSTDTFYPLLRCLAGFGLGAVSYRLSKSWVGLIKRIPYAGDAVTVAVLICLSIQNIDILVVILMIPLIICLAEGKSITGVVLGTPLLHWLGTVSYSIYLVHTLVNGLFRSRLTDLLSSFHIPHGYTVGGLLLLVPTIGLSMATYVLIERPARDGLRRLASKRVPISDRLINEPVFVAG